MILWDFLHVPSNLPLILRVFTQLQHILFLFLTLLQCLGLPKEFFILPKDRGYLS